MEGQTYSAKFFPAQTPLAMEIQGVALWVAAHIGTDGTGGVGMDNMDMILVRNNLLCLAERLEALESSLEIAHDISSMPATSNSLGGAA